MFVKGKTVCRRTKHEIVPFASSKEALSAEAWSAEALSSEAYRPSRIPCSPHACSSHPKSCNPRTTGPNICRHNDGNLQCVALEGTSPIMNIKFVSNSQINICVAEHGTKSYVNIPLGGEMYPFSLPAAVYHRYLRHQYCVAYSETCGKIHY